MKNVFWILMAFISGAILPIQAGLNARLGKALNNAVLGSLISFVVGTIGLIIYVLITRQQGNLSGIRNAPITDLTGGLLGAFYVTVIIFAFPKIGPALTFGLVVAGQMILSVILDHTNTLVAEPHPFNIYRLLGIILIIGGVIIIRKF
jgi:transporter family-2 protein